MAVDQLLLEQAVSQNWATLRLYRWAEPTLSLGYFQAHCERAAHAASREAALVRRQSGGGAILHDQELTYSLALPATHPLAASPAQVYAAVHAVLVKMLNELVADAQPFRPCAQKTSEQPFLCFQRREIGDIVYGTTALDGRDLRQDHKVVGSAQRRWHGAVLQHGSILLGTSPFAPELCGIEQLCDVAIDAFDFQQQFAVRLVPTIGMQKVFGSSSQEGAWAADCHATIERMCEDRYRNRTWNERR